MEAKKLSLLRILQILDKYSDYDHPLTQGRIIEIMKNDYDTFIERKAVSRNISYLEEAGYDIISRGRSGVYLNSRKFENSELRLLIDSVMASKHIDKKHSEDLIKKLTAEGGLYFNNSANFIYYNKKWQKTDNQTVFYNIEILDEAIRDNVKVQFLYNIYNTKKQLIPKREHAYLVSPFRLLIHNQRYYLICNNENYDDVSFFRIDKITNIVKTYTTSKDFNNIKAFSQLDLDSIDTALPYMFADKIQKIRFKCNSERLDDIVDWFGNNFEIEEQKNNTLFISLKASPKAMKYWALQYCEYVEIISPEFLREDIKRTLYKSGKQYNDKKGELHNENNDNNNIL